MHTPEVLRTKVLQAIAAYAEAGTILKARSDVGLGGMEFYQFLREHPEVDNLYRDTQRARADMMVDESYGLGLAPPADPRAARVMADIRLKIAGMYDRARYGEKVQLDVVSVDITGALTEARGRALRPMSDLALVSDAQVIEHIERIAAPRTDTQSVPASKPPPVDIFADE